MPLYRPTNMIPDWADPAQTSVMDPLYKTLARRAVHLTGLDDPNTAVTSLANPMMAAEGPAGGVIGDMLKSIPGKTGQAAEALIDHLNSFKLPRMNKKTAGVAFSKEGSIGAVPPPTAFTTILNRTVKRVPEAEDQLSAPYKFLSRPTELQKKYATQARVRGKLTPTLEERLSTDLAKGTYDRPAVTSFDQLADVAPSIKQNTATPPPPLIGALRNGAGNNQATAALAKIRLSEDQIRALRGMSQADAVAAYPNMKPETLRGIRTRDTFGWIKD